MEKFTQQINTGFETKEINISQIVVKDIIQQRENLNNSCVEDYVEELSNGTVFPPLVVYDDGEGLLLADGFHRYEAYKKAGSQTVTVHIYKGSERDAILHAAGANADHGLRRTNADKRKAVETLLKDIEWNKWSDTSIAKKCRVSQPFVGKIRSELTNNGYESSPKRIGEDGREYDTSKIGIKLEDVHPGEPSTAGTSERQQSGPDSQSCNEEDHPKASDQDTSAELSVTQTEDKMEKDSEASGTEGNKDSYGADTNVPDESTSDELEAKESSPDEKCAEQNPQEEDVSEQTGDEESPSVNETEVAADIGISTEPESVESQLTSIEPPDTDDIQTLKAEIVELKKTIIRKDRRITELEQEVSELKEKVTYYEAEAMSPFRSEPHEVPSNSESINYQNSYTL